MRVMTQLLSLSLEGVSPQRQIRGTHTSAAATRPACSEGRSPQGPRFSTGETPAAPQVVCVHLTGNTRGAEGGSWGFPCQSPSHAGTWGAGMTADGTHAFSFGLSVAQTAWHWEGTARCKATSPQKKQVSCCTGCRAHGKGQEETAPPVGRHRERRFRWGPGQGNAGLNGAARVTDTLRPTAPPLPLWPPGPLDPPAPSEASPGPGCTSAHSSEPPFGPPLGLGTHFRLHKGIKAIERETPGLGIGVGVGCLCFSQEQPPPSCVTTLPVPPDTPSSTHTC